MGIQARIDHLGDGPKRVYLEARRPIDFSPRSTYIDVSVPSIPIKCIDFCKHKQGDRHAVLGEKGIDSDGRIRYRLVCLSIVIIWQEARCAEKFGSWLRKSLDVDADQLNP